MTTHILTHFHKRRTGVTTHVEDLVRALNASGRKAVVLGESISSNTPQVSRGDVEALLQTGRPVTWHAQRTHSLREGLRLRQQWPHLRVLWTHHNWKPPGWLTTRLLKQADGVVCLTQEGADQLRTNAAVIAAVIGHGVPLDLIQPAPLPLEPRLGVIGRIRPDKGHRSVVEAFARVKPTSPSWTIRFFGETRPQHRRFQKTLQRQLPDSL
ncbi:MAG: hypothetical protein VXW32_10760, partial [Myxococcota bacterium]|nr:hypothetical protein [Myxococcota bacterium]